MLCEYGLDMNLTFHDLDVYLDWMSLMRDDDLKGTEPFEYKKILSAINNLIIVRIRYQVAEAQMTIQEPRTTLSDKIANFGGTFGIWAELTGISLLGIINILIIMFKIVTTICHSKK